VVRLLRDRRGVAALEFALTGSAFSALLLLAMEAAWQLALAGGLDYGAREASRWAATGPTVAATTTIEAEVRRRVASSSGLAIDPTRLAIATENFSSVGSLNAGTGGTAGSGSAGSMVRYRITYSAPALTPLGATFMTNGMLQHSFSVIVRNEPYAR
jgi:Flp pilus assembly protein TadG